MMMMAELQDDGLLSFVEAQRLLSCGRHTLDRLVREGRLEVIYLDRKKRITRASIRKLIDDLKRKAPTKRGAEEKRP